MTAQIIATFLIILPLPELMDTQLIDTLHEMAQTEKKIKEFKRKIRFRGKITKKSLTKNKNIRLSVKKGEDKFNFIILKTHKERYALADKLTIGTSVYVEGISRFRAIICTKLKQIKRIDESEQSRLETFSGYVKKT